MVSVPEWVEIGELVRDVGWCEVGGWLCEVDGGVGFSIGILRMMIFRKVGIDKISHAVFFWCRFSNSDDAQQRESFRFYYDFYISNSMWWFP